MKKVKLPKHENDLPKIVVQLAKSFISSINLFVIAHDITDEEIELATAWVARLYTDQEK